MAVSDAELIQLLKGAEAGTRGPQGEPGIGIDEIVQSDPSSFVITLTNGKTHRIELAAGRDGAPGRPGRDGSRGTKALLVAEAERARWDPPEPMEETESMA